MFHSVVTNAPFIGRVEKGVETSVHITHIDLVFAVSLDVGYIMLSYRSYLLHFRQRATIPAAFTNATESVWCYVLWNLSCCQDEFFGKKTSTRFVGASPNPKL